MHRRHSDGSVISVNIVNITWGGFGWLEGGLGGWRDDGINVVGGRMGLNVVRGRMGLNVVGGGMGLMWLDICWVYRPKMLRRGKKLLIGEIHLQ